MAAEFVQRGRLCVEQGQLQEAVRICRLGLLANPGEIEGRLVLGSALSTLSRYDEVLAEMKVALDMEPSNPSALALKGEALLHKGDAPQAVAVLQEAALHAPGDPFVEQLLGEARNAAAHGPPPSMTLDVDPEFEGTEIRAPDLGPHAIHWPAAATPELRPASQDSEIEELDADLLMDATPTPIPIDNAVNQGKSLPLQAAAPPFRESPFEVFRETPDQSPSYRHDVDSSPPAQMSHRPPIPQARPATIGTLFPDDEDSGVDVLLQAPPGSPQGVDAQPAEAGRFHTADMNLIRESLHSQPAPAQPMGMSVAIQAPTETRRPEVATKRQRSIPMWGWLAITLFFIGAGATGGLKIRDMRLQRQIDGARMQAAQHARGGTYADARRARDMYRSILSARKDDRSLAALAMSEALLSAEFGDPVDAARAAVARVKDNTRVDAIAARAYLAVVSGESAGAIAVSKQLVDSYPNAAIGHYLLGHANILAGNAEAATAALNTAIDLGPTPLTYVALARAESQAGRFREALAAVARANEASPGLPAALIWQARILLESHELPEKTADLDDKLVALIHAEGEWMDLSPAQEAWAGLVLVEIKLQRGELAAAKKVLADVKMERPPDWMFSEMLMDILVRLGDFGAAKTEAERAITAWPHRSKPKIILARVALAEGDIDGAMLSLEAMEEIETSHEALTIRAFAEIELGKLEQAATDLELALSQRSRYTEALIGRAQIDMLRGDASAAIARLEPVYDRSAAPELAVAYAAALRTSGKTLEARKVLEPLVAADGGIAALIELAQLERTEGRFEESRAAFQEAIALDGQSPEARLGAALLDIDDGRVEEGREALDALVVKDDNRGLVLVEAARAHTLTGDAEGAAKLLEQATAKAAWLGWQVARERGRVHLHRLLPIDAINELQRAQSLRPEDEETRILLMEAHFEARDKRGAGRALQDITKMFRDSPVRSIAVGLYALQSENADEAVKAFSEAQSKLVDAAASRMRLARVAYWLGRSYEFSGDLRKAAKWLEKATALDTSHAAAYYWLGQIHHMNQKPALMMAAYERSVEIDPGSHPLAWYFLATNYVQAKETDKAIAAFESFLKYFPEESGDMVADANKNLRQLR